MRRISCLLAMLVCAAAFGQSPVEAVFIASTNAAFSNSWTIRIPLSVTNSAAFTNFPIEGVQYLKVRSVNPPSILPQAPPTPTTDTNLAEVGSVNVAWDDMTIIDPSIEWYGVYLGTTNVLIASTNAATIPLYAYGTNWISVTSIDASLLESDPSPAISYNLVSMPPTNVVTVSLYCSTNATTWTYVQPLLALTNPPGNRFFKLSISNSIATQ